jgi:UDP-2,4-diacetamido-2,4,6-trideoxy-beta-L-altropyranose hydrolase
VKVAVRTDVSTRIGTGHLVRCLTLADGLRRAGAEVRFVSRQHDVPVAGRIHEAGFELIELPAAAAGVATADGDYAAWLGVTQQRDAAETLRALGDQEVDLLVVDHYGLDARWESRLTEVCGAVLVIDDLADRPHAAEVVLDQNLRADGAFAYTSLVPDRCRVLSGPGYALLREEYVQARRPWVGRDGAGRVLVTLGGVDDLDLIRVIADGLGQLEQPPGAVDLVVADPGRVRAVLGRLAARLPLRLHGPQPHLADLMSHADLAVGAGGSTTWERLCVGLPSVVTSRAANQRRGTRELAALGAIIDLGDAAALTPALVRDAVAELAASQSKRRRLHELGQALVDGHGCERAVEAVCPTAASALTLREAESDDRRPLWMWANDRTVRAQSLHPDPIRWDAHLAWFQQLQDDPDRWLLILEAAGLPVGQLRLDFDLHGTRATVNYSLDACVRGRGWGRQIIELGLDWLCRNVAARPLEVAAVVRVDNTASARVFQRLGFDRQASTQDGHDVFRYTRTLES